MLKRFALEMNQGLSYELHPWVHFRLFCWRVTFPAKFFTVCRYLIVIWNYLFTDSKISMIYSAISCDHQLVMDCIPQTLSIVFLYRFSPDPHPPTGFIISALTCFFWAISLLLLKHIGYHWLQGISGVASFCAAGSSQAEYWSGLPFPFPWMFYLWRSLFYCDIRTGTVMENNIDNFQW